MVLHAYMFHSFSLKLCPKYFSAQGHFNIQSISKQDLFLIPILGEFRLIFYTIYYL